MIGTLRLAETDTLNTFGNKAPCCLQPFSRILDLFEIGDQSLESRGIDWALPLDPFVAEECERYSAREFLLLQEF